MFSLFLIFSPKCTDKSLVLIRGIYNYSQICINVCLPIWIIGKIIFVCDSLPILCSFWVHLHFMKTFVSNIQRILCKSSSNNNMKQELFMKHDILDVIKNFVVTIHRIYHYCSFYWSNFSLYNLRLSETTKHKKEYAKEPYRQCSYELYICSD